MNKKYVPSYLSSTDKKKQIRSIKNQTIRPTLSSAKPRRSSYTKQFEDKYGFKNLQYDLLVSVGVATLKENNQRVVEIKNKMEKLKTLIRG